MRSLALVIALFVLSPALGASAAQVNKIAATVNGQIITMLDLQKEALPEFARARINPNDPARKAESDEILRRVLDMMIMDKLVAQEAKRLKATVSAGRRLRPPEAGPPAEGAGYPSRKDHIHYYCYQACDLS